jgi:hypothetical protein
MSRNDISTEELQEAVDAVAAHGSKAAAARVLGMPENTLRNRYAVALRAKMEPKVQALIVGEKAAPGPGMALRGTSTLYGEDGTAKLQWIKTDRDTEKLFALQKAALAAMCAEIKPIAKIAAPKRNIADLLTLITLTDCHVGALAWDKETGEDWDLNIAEDCLVGTFTRMIDAAPASAVGIVNQLGDFLHIDSLTPTTPTSHHILDADSRYQKMVEVAVRILRRIIEHALGKFEHLQIYLFEGNHDPAGSVWLRVMFSQLYADNPRVKVGMSPNPYVAYQHGKTLLGFHHGHLKGVKGLGLPLLFAAKFPVEWGATEYRYIHTGHLHHVEEKENPGAKTIQHPTLAAPDAYAARYGFLSKRQATSMTYHRELGEIARATFIPVK